MVGQQTDELQFGLLPDGVAETVGTELAMQPIHGLLDAIVIELNAIPDRLLAFLPERPLKALLGQRRALVKQAIVFVEAVDQHSGNGFRNQIIGTCSGHGAETKDG